MSTRGVNKVILIGRLGGDPEVRYMPNDGGTVANMTLATSETWRDKATGQQREKTEWHRIALFGKVAEVAGEYLRKGSQVYIEGQLRTRKWQDQQGKDQYTTEVVVSGYRGMMQMLSPASNDRGANWGQPQQPQPQQQQQQPQQQQQRPQQQYNEPPMDFDDDIPFAPLGLQYPALMHCIS